MYKSVTVKIKKTANTNSLENCLKDGAKKFWKFVHHEDYQYYSERLRGRYFSKNWLSIENGLVTVKGSFNNKKGYAWDGCTPKFNFMDITWVIPDGKTIQHTEPISGKTHYAPITYYASMIHDALYQYKRCIPVTRKEADLIFYDILKGSKFSLAWLYYGLSFWMGLLEMET